MDVKRVGRAGLSGWREQVARRIAPAVSARTRFDEDAIRAALGLAWLALSVYYVARAARDVVRD